MHKEVRAAVLGNAGTTIAFRVSGDDAENLSKPLGLPASQIAQLARGEIAVKYATLPSMTSKMATVLPSSTFTARPLLNS